MSAVPFHIRLRRAVKNFFDKSLRFFSPTPSTKQVDKSEIKRIFVVRINYRIGNMLFTTPMIQQLQREFPNAKIDVMVGAPFTKVLFSGFENVENIYDFPRELLKKPLEMMHYVSRLRSQEYDIVFNINGGSTSDRIATLLARSKYKVAFCNEDSFTPVNRCVKREDLQINHEALKPLELLKICGIKPDYDLKLSIALSGEELEWGRAELANLTKDKNGRKIGIFRNARYDKKLSDDFWKELIQKLQEQSEEPIIFIDILSPDIPARLTHEMLEYSQKDLRKLATFMAGLDAFVCGDTGPMHLASASGVPTIALFKTTAPDMYGTLKESDYSLVMREKTTGEIAREILEHISTL